ncbi:hypothetical protein JZ751_029734, partial [Albula glossodonta]
MEDLPHKDLILGIYIFTFIIGFPANMLALFAFVRKVRQKPTPIDILLLNLTISDIILLVFLPFRMKEAVDDMQWNMPYFLCPLSGFLFYTTIYNSIFLLTAVSVERYLGVAFPIKYKLKRKPIYAVVACAIFWLVSSAHCSIVYIMQYFEDYNNATEPPHERNTCYWDFSKAQLEVLLPVRLELFLVLFCIPFLVCCFCYINFIRILSQLPNISLHKRQRAMGMAAATLLVFICCFGPYNVSHVVGYINWKSPKWRVHALLFSTLNACLDPLVFYFSSSAVRSIIKHILKRLVGRLYLPCSMQPIASELMLLVYLVTFITGLPANMLAFYAFCQKVRQKPAPIDILLLNLTVSDLIFLLFLPFKMKEAVDNKYWNMPYFLCPFSGFLFYTTIYNSIFFLTAVSVERYLGVMASVFFWVISFMHLSIVYIVPYYNPKGVNGSFPPDKCYENFTAEQLEILLPVRLELCLVLFCVPFLISSFCYINFIRILSRLPNISRRRRLRAIGLALGTILVFALCFVPYNASHVVGFITKKSPEWRDVALLFSTFNACLDPLIFYFSSAAVRNTLSRVVRGSLGKLRTSCCCGCSARCCPPVDSTEKD